MTAPFMRRYLIRQRVFGLLYRKASTFLARPRYRLVKRIDITGRF